MHNLPALLSSFIGRQNEIAEVAELLRVHRLVTLTGPGGCGKTRLALQVATEALPSFEDGTWLIELGSLADPALVPQTVAATLGVREQTGRPLTETLSAYLCAHRALLLLDNCEHLVQACAEFAATLLQTCPKLKILATSREALGVDGEAIWAVPPLSLPEMPGAEDAAGKQPSHPIRGQSEAVELFLARAESALPGFSLTTENTAVAEGICRRLDGMPLAIELAAARLRALSVEEIAAHLDDRFQLLSAGSRTAPARHQTLEATLDWSYALLSDTERTGLQRLSAFSGGCSLEAAEAMCSAAVIDGEHGLDLLTRLVDKSLLVAKVSGGRSRFRLLETIRDYARRKLAESRANCERARLPPPILRGMGRGSRASSAAHRRRAVA